MTIREALLKYKELCNMDEIRWQQFCRRYSQKCTPTIISYIEKTVGKLPHNAEKVIEKTLATFLCEK